MINKHLIIFVVILVNLSLTSCRNADLNGIIIKTAENQILLATELSSEEYEEIKELPASQIQNADVLSDAYYGLINLTYQNTEKFTPGDYVEVWIDGDVLESYPLQANAKKISLIRESIK